MKNAGHGMPDNSKKDRDLDQSRQREILRRTRMGLEEDLDDLRSDLLPDLEDFESRLRRTALHLPRWLNLPEDALRSSFELTYPESLQGTLVGPRTVAIVASDMEEFLRIWLGEDGLGIPAWEARDDEESRSRLQQDLQSLQEIITSTVESVSSLAEEGPFALEQLLESIVFELETRRETDVVALESLIHDGDINAGRAAQEEIAGLWEEQRSRVNQLQRVWDDILVLHHEGISKSLRGLQELKELADRSRDGIAGAGLLGPLRDENPLDEAQPSSNPFLRAPSEVSDTSEPKEVLAIEASVDTGANELDGPTADEVKSPLLEPSPPATDLGRDLSGTEEINYSEEGLPDEAFPEVGPTEQIGDSQLDLIDHASPTLPLSSDGEADLPLDEAHKAPRAQPSRPATGTSTFIREPSLTSADNQPLQEDDAGPRERPEVKQAADPDDEQIGDTLESLPTQSPQEKSAPSRALSRERKGSKKKPESLPVEESKEESELLRVRAYRLREDWQVMPLGEVIATLSPPAAFVGTFFVLSFLSLFEIVENPMIRWHWAFPVTLAAMGLLVVIPIGFKWRPMWRGTRFSLLRKGPVEDEVDLLLTESKLYFDRIAWPLRELRASEPSRWESPEEELCGWVMTLDPPYHAPLQVATFVDLENESWEADPTAVDDPPEEAWHVPADEFHRLVLALRD